MERSESMMAPTDLLKIERALPTDEQERIDRKFNHKERVQNLLDEEQLIKLCTDAGFVKIVVVWQYFITKDAEQLQ